MVTFALCINISPIQHLQADFALDFGLILLYYSVLDGNTIKTLTFNIWTDGIHTYNMSHKVFTEKQEIVNSSRSALIFEI
jgi:hypothetical protein